MKHGVDSSGEVFSLAPLHDNVENGVDKQIDHENGQDVRVEIDAVRY